MNEERTAKCLRQMEHIPGHLWLRFWMEINRSIRTVYISRACIHYPLAMFYLIHRHNCNCFSIMFVNNGRFLTYPDNTISRNHQHKETHHCYHLKYLQCCSSYYSIKQTILPRGTFPVSIKSRCSGWQTHSLSSI